MISQAVCHLVQLYTNLGAKKMNFISGLSTLNLCAEFTNSKFMFKQRKQQTVYDLLSNWIRWTSDEIIISLKQWHQRSSAEALGPLEAIYRYFCFERTIYFPRKVFLVNLTLLWKAMRSFSSHRIQPLNRLCSSFKPVLCHINPSKSIPKCHLNMVQYQSHGPQQL